MIKPRRIGHATFATPDLDKAVDHYTGITGLVLAARDKDRAFLATRIGQLAIVIERGEAAACSKLSFEIAPNSDFAELRRLLSEEGIASEERADPMPGIPRMLTFRDPKGTEIELFSEWSCVGPRRQAAGVGPLKLGHVAFFTPDPAAMAAFYTRVLDFKVSDWIGDFFVFMRCNPDHHTVNFFRGEVSRLHHFAFELKDMTHLQGACDLLAEHDIPVDWGPLRVGPGHNMAAFHRNHDGQVVEFYAELDQMKDEELGYFEPRPWHRDCPQRPKVWSPDRSTIWGPPQPAIKRG